jgi:hypothetical protein
VPDITYVGKSDGDYFDMFHYLADDQSEKRDGSQRRPVMEILVDPTDSIWVCGVNGLSIPQPTKGTVHRHTDEQFEAAGIDASYVCLGSVAAYVVPRIATLMARVYCPTPEK